MSEGTNKLSTAELTMFTGCPTKQFVIQEQCTGRPNKQCIIQEYCTGCPTKNNVLFRNNV